MGKRNSDDQSQNSGETTEPEKASMFERLFAPASLDTSVSSHSDDDQSMGSKSNLSTLSGSTDGSGDSSDSSSAGIRQFDRELRAKHRGACKNMTVSAGFGCELSFCCLAL